MAADAEDVLGLIYFAHVVQEGSFTAAAARLGVAKSAVSRRVAALEARVGARLLHRTTRRVAPSPDGARLFAHAQPLLRAADDALELADGAGAVRGEIKVTAPASLGMTHLTDAVAGFLAAHPDVTVQLSLDDSVVDLITEGVDVAIRVRSRLDDSALISRRLGRARLLVVASPAYLAAHGTPRVPDDLALHTFVRYAHQTGDRLAFRGPDGTPMPVQPRGRLVLDGGPALRRAALAGAGLTVLPSFAVDEDLAAGRLIALLRDYPLPELTLWAVSPPGRWMPTRVRAFVDWLAASFRAPPWQAVEHAPDS